jgi:hypothetical protein
MQELLTISPTRPFTLNPYWEMSMLRLFSPILIWLGLGEPVIKHPIEIAAYVAMILSGLIFHVVNMIFISCGIVDLKRKALFMKLLGNMLSPKKP